MKYMVKRVRDGYVCTKKSVEADSVNAAAVTYCRKYARSSKEDIILDVSAMQNPDKGSP